MFILLYDMFDYVIIIIIIIIIATQNNQLICLVADQASFPRRSNHKSSTKRLPDDGEDAQVDVRAARVHP